MTSYDEIPALRALRDQLATLDVKRSRHRRGVTRRVLVIMIAATLVVGGAAAAITQLGKARLGRVSAPEEGAGLRPRRGSERIVARTSDPGGGAPWVVQTYRSADGRTCTQVGQLVGDVIGLARRGGGVERSAAGGCSRASERNPVAVSLFQDAADRREGLPARTVISGLASAKVTELRLSGTTISRMTTPGADGAFIFVLSGANPDLRLLLRATFEDGSTVRVPVRAFRPPPDAPG